MIRIKETSLSLIRNLKKKIPKLNKSSSSEQNTLGINYSKSKYILSRLKKGGHEIHKYFRYSGILNYFSLWNTLFPLLILIIIQVIYINSSIPKISSEVGLNTDNIDGYDTTISNDVLYIFPLANTFLLILITTFGIKYTTKFKYLFLITFLYIIVVGTLQLITIKDITDYFSL